MKNLKKLSRVELKNLKGGRSCALAIQGSDGTWVTRSGTCSTYYAPSAGGGVVGYSYCETGLGMVSLTSNGGVSHCAD